MDFYYAPPDGISGDTIAVTGDDVHHISRVMRKSIGDEIYVSSGEGVMYRTVIEQINRDSIQCAVTAIIEGYNELPRNIVLVQGVLKNPSKMDFIVEKAVELGVGRIVPVESRYTVAKGGKVNRWRSLALAAMKQCGRCVLPAIDDINSLQSAFDSLSGLCIVCYEQEEIPVSVEAQLLRNTETTEPIVVFIGPEGGFSTEELARFRESGALFASLGGRRLRSETAAVCALARAAAVIEQPFP